MRKREQRERDRKYIDLYTPENILINANVSDNAYINNIHG